MEGHLFMPLAGIKTQGHGVTRSIKSALCSRCVPHIKNWFQQFHASL